ncbi:CBS domain-containing protein [Sulfitobacter sp. HI0082]|jgi:CBS domain-containing protein|uniref:CBS domain-containing protein n=1 Tax=Sulfitobacter sp. TaxID=1903071 RepID=UPI0007CF15B6|nr:CBS domain-containing protein [Sulfitobacter sp.]KZZ28129.1 CBS domain-containing protein [Sulfitobacter sp. HI0082]MBD82765.1 CBS domain-containing protein [Sulfitobacter sp.]HAC50939.1 CBS domain-containing protein [Sulfitobacter sp.]HCQ58835.1 CBS domain-containing protein [Sulfitobacter sp.]|tara:strand:- start:23 stop:457 length:435 start_codon:yes stop_codon:yes gene_type:complete
MQVQEIMTSNPTCCGPDASVQEAAKLMDDKSVGSIPVVNDAGEPVGIVTDRDICCGAVAQGKGTDTRVSDVMSKDVLTAAPDEDVESCCNKMEEKQVRRTVVTDDAGKCCGIVAQADVAREADGKETAELVQEVSRPEKRSGCC